MNSYNVVKFCMIISNTIISRSLFFLDFKIDNFLSKFFIFFLYDFTLPLHFFFSFFSHSLSLFLFLISFYHLHHSTTFSLQFLIFFQSYKSTNTSLSFSCTSSFFNQRILWICSSLSSTETRMWWSLANQSEAFLVPADQCGTPLYRHVQHANVWRTQPNETSLPRSRETSVVQSRRCDEWSRHDILYWKPGTISQ